MATFYDKGQTFDLPSLDMKMWERLEAIDAAEPGRATFKAMHDFVKACLPDDYLESKLGGKSIDKIDLNRLNICAFAVKAAYNREVNEAKTEINAESMEQLRDISESLKGITEASKEMRTSSSRQAFKAVR